MTDNVFTLSPRRLHHGAADGYRYDPDSVVVSPDGAMILATSERETVIISPVDGVVSSAYPRPYRRAGFIVGSRYLVMELVDDTIVIIDTTTSPMEQIYSDAGHNLFLSRRPNATMCGFSYNGGAYILAVDVREDVIHRRHVRSSQFSHTVWLWDDLMRPFGYARQEGDDVHVAILPSAGRTMMSGMICGAQLGVDVHPISFYANQETQRWELFCRGFSSTTGEHGVFRLSTPFDAQHGDALSCEDVFLAPAGRVTNVLVGGDGAPYMVEWWDGAQQHYEAIDSVSLPKHHRILPLLLSTTVPFGFRQHARMLTEDTAVIVRESLTTPATITCITPATSLTMNPQHPCSPSLGVDSLDSFRSKPVNFQARDDCPLSYTLTSMFDQTVNTPQKRRKNAPPALVMRVDPLSALAVGGYNETITGFVSNGMTVLTPVPRGVFFRAPDMSVQAQSCDALDAISLATYYRFISSSLIVSQGGNLSPVIDMMTMSSSHAHHVRGVYAMFPHIDFAGNERTFSRVHRRVIVAHDPHDSSSHVVVDAMMDMIPKRASKHMTFSSGEHNDRDALSAADAHVMSFLKKS